MHAAVVAAHPYTRWNPTPTQVASQEGSGLTSLIRFRRFSHLATVSPIPGTAAGHARIASLFMHMVCVRTCVLLDVLPAAYATRW